MPAEEEPQPAAPAASKEADERCRTPTTKDEQDQPPPPPAAAGAAAEERQRDDTPSTTDPEPPKASTEDPDTVGDSSRTVEEEQKSGTHGASAEEKVEPTEDLVSQQPAGAASGEEAPAEDREKQSTVASSPPRPDEDEDEEDDDDEEPGDNEDERAASGREDGYSEGREVDGGRRAAQSETPTGAQYYEDDEEDEEDDGEEPSELRRLFEPINDSQAQSEDEEDGDYIPDEEVKKTIMVGSDFQAVIPEGLCRYDDALPYENEDKLLWNPTMLNEQEIEDYLVKITSAPGGTGAQKGSSDPQTNSVYSIPLGSHLRDDEQSLYLLQQCGHNVDEALRRRRISNNAVPAPEQQMSIWSEEECRNFENGLRVHGKDFHMIQQTKVRTRSVGELVQFYYLWKKTERHDVFASKARLEKKKYNLHPGLTDHMDRFLEEQENSTGFGDRSSSPGFNSLYSSASEAKRQRLLDSKEHNTASSKRTASNL